MPKSLWIACRVNRRRAFTLVEVLVAMTVLVLLIGMIAQMTGGMSSIIGRGQAHINTDGQARALLDRMAIDFEAMIKRSDVDYYLKGRPITLTQTTQGIVGTNDQIAFYSEVPGYFPTTTGTALQSTVSLVAYRVNATTMHMERLCKGLAWNGASTSNTGNNYTMGFLPVPLASALPSPLPSPTPSAMPTPGWPQAADPTTKDLDYEELGPQVFRFEYYYVLKGQNLAAPATPPPTLLSLTPWYANAPVSHTAVNGMQDVAGIGILIAVIDSKSRSLVSQDQLAALASQMEDAPTPTASNAAGGTAAFANPGDIEKQWVSAVNSSTLPKSATATIRVYTRCFYLNGVPH